MGRTRSIRPLTGEERRLVEDHLDFARRMAGILAGRNSHIDVDWESECYLHLCRCAQRYNPRTGTSFATFAVARLRGLEIDLIRGSNPIGWRRYRARGLSTQPGTESLEPSLAGGDLPVGWEIEALDAVESLTRGLRGRGRAIVRALFIGAGATQRSIARERGVSFSYINLLYGQALEELRDTVGRR